MNQAITVALLNISVFTRAAVADTAKEKIAALPEIAMLALVGLGMTGFGLLRLRRKRD